MYSNPKTVKQKNEVSALCLWSVMTGENVHLTQRQIIGGGHQSCLKTGMDMSSKPTA